jgi:hypothetical protein
MKFLFVFLLSICAFVHGCTHCNPDWTPVPFCQSCPDTIFGSCLTPHARTCGYVDALVDNTKSCSKGSWACMPDCCKK